MKGLYGRFAIRSCVELWNVSKANYLQAMEVCGLHIVCIPFHSKRQSCTEANPPFWHNTEMQDLFHLIILRHQNTKTAE